MIITENEKYFDTAKFEEESMNKYGFYMHLLVEPTNDKDSPTHCNLHTHGLKEKYGHLDFQIVAQLPPELSSTLIHDLVKRIKKGEQFKDGMEDDKLLQGGYVVRFIEATEGDRLVLRILIPDENNKFGEEAMWPYSMQTQGVY